MNIKKTTKKHLLALLFCTFCAGQSVSLMSMQNNDQKAKTTPELEEQKNEESTILPDWMTLQNLLCIAPTTATLYPAIKNLRANYLQNRSIMDINKLCMTFGLPAATSSTIKISPRNLVPSLELIKYALLLSGALKTGFTIYNNKDLIVSKYSEGKDALIEGYKNLTLWNAGKFLLTIPNNNPLAIGASTHLLTELLIALNSKKLPGSLRSKAASLSSIILFLRLVNIFLNNDKTYAQTVENGKNLGILQNTVNQNQKQLLDELTKQYNELNNVENNVTKKIDDTRTEILEMQKNNQEETIQNFKELESNIGKLSQTTDKTLQAIEEQGSTIDTMQTTIEKSGKKLTVLGSNAYTTSLLLGQAGNKLNKIYEVAKNEQLENQSFRHEQQELNTNTNLGVQELLKQTGANHKQNMQEHELTRSVLPKESKQRLEEQKHLMNTLNQDKNK